MDKELFLSFFTALARHGATTLGGILVANGWLAESDITTLVGAAVALVGLAFSVGQKFFARKKAKEEVERAKEGVLNVD